MKVSQSTDCGRKPGLGETGHVTEISRKIAVITGGSSGIGLATAKRFADEGAYVFITNRRQSELDGAVKEIGRNVTGIQGDVVKLADIDKIYAAVKEQKGKADIIFANAGIGEFAPFGQVTEEHFDKHFAVNVKGVLFTVQKALPLLREGGSVILNASVVATKGFPAFTVYSATKAAVRSFARTWSVDLKGQKIRVNVVSPGVVPTPAYSLSLGIERRANRSVRRKLDPEHSARPCGYDG